MGARPIARAGRRVRRLVAGWTVAMIVVAPGSVSAQVGSTSDETAQKGHVLGGFPQEHSDAQAPARAASGEEPQRWDWQRWERPGFDVYAAGPEDVALMPQLLDAIEEARRELEGRWGLQLPAGIAVHVHPDLVSFQAASGMPWYVAGIARSSDSEVHLQRLRVLQERGGLRLTVRHELFHLAQPSDWPRWLAEGAAMIYAGETPAAAPLGGVSASELDSLLGRPPNRETLLRAQATAYHRALASPELGTAGRD